jgi:hypothetical protein
VELDAIRQADASPVEFVSDGRRATTSVDRYLQRVSLTGSRAAESSPSAATTEV